MRYMRNGLVNKRNIVAIAFLLAAQSMSVWAQAEPPSPWPTQSRERALVFIEVPTQKGSSNGSGFIIGQQDANFVVTSSHVLFPEMPVDKQPPTGCTPLLPGTVLLEGTTGGNELRAACVYHLGYDVALIKLEPRLDPLATLSLSDQRVVVSDWLFLGGFPRRQRDITRRGIVSTVNVENEMVITNIITTEGMSGGPYLTPEGVVVGIHQGTARYAPGFTYMMPIWKVLPKILEHVGPITTKAPAPNSSRRSVHVLRYVPDHPQLLGQFLGLLQQKMEQIPNSFRRFASEEQLRELSYKQFNETANVEERLRRWKELAPLLILSGTVFPGRDIISSNIFVGEKDEVFETEVIPGAFIVGPEQAGTIVDSHMVMLLYALAKDAHARKRGANVVTAYLTQAKSIASDLGVTQRNPEYVRLADEITEILSRINPNVPR